jgi:hypothetical protein
MNVVSTLEQFWPNKKKRTDDEIEQEITEIEQKIEKEKRDIEGTT